MQQPAGKPPRAKKRNVYERLENLKLLTGQFYGCSGGTGSSVLPTKKKAPLPDTDDEIRQVERENHRRSQTGQGFLRMTDPPVD